MYFEITERTKCKTIRSGGFRYNLQIFFLSGGVDGCSSKSEGRHSVMFDLSSCLPI